MNDKTDRFPFMDMTYWVSDDDGLVHLLFQKIGFKKANRVEDANVTVFTGGADVNPEIYGHVKHPNTDMSFKRDLLDTKTLRASPKSGLRVGICRGGQFLNVKNGGKMWQDCDNHALRDEHHIRYKDTDGTGSRWAVTSTHHQMMIPAKDACQVWGDVPITRCTYKDLGGDRREPVDKLIPDYEILWYPGTNSLCFQPHPEYDHVPTATLFTKCLARAFHIMETR